MSAFWDDLARDLEDPEFRHSFIVEALRVEIMRQAASPFVGDAVVDCGITIGIEQPDCNWFNLDLEALANAVEKAWTRP